MKIIKYLPLVFLPIVCWADIELASESVTLAKDDTKRVLQIALKGEGNWTASTDADWITLMRTSGTETSVPFYRLKHNYSTDFRTGTIVVNGLNFTVVQKGYDATLDRESVTVPAIEMSSADFVSFEIEKASDATPISWTAKADQDWVTVTPLSGTADAEGHGVVSYRVSENDEKVERIATLRIAGQKFVITQEAADESGSGGETSRVSLLPSEFTIPCAARELTVNVVAEADVSWSVEGGASWVNVFNTGSGVGSSTIGLAVLENLSVKSRRCEIMIGGKTLTVIQNGTSAYRLGTTPSSTLFPYKGGVKDVTFNANEDLEWTAISKNPWLTLLPGNTVEKSSAGEQALQIQASVNSTLSVRTGTVEIAAHIPYPNVDIMRGLTLWRETNLNGGYAHDDKSVRDPDVKGETEGVWFVINSNLNSLHRLFDLNDGAASLYVTEENKLVLDAPSGNIVDLRFPVEQNVTYDLFVVSSETNTLIYGGLHDSGVYRELHASDVVLKISAYGHTTKPSEDWLVWGKSSQGAYYYWTRALNAAEMLNIPSECPRVSQPTDAVYANLHLHCPFNGFGTSSGERLYSSQAQMTTDRHGHGQNAMTGDLNYNRITHVGTIVSSYGQFPQTYTDYVTIRHSSSWYDYYIRYLDFHGSLLDLAKWSYMVEGDTALSAAEGTVNIWVNVRDFPTENSVLFRILRVRSYYQKLDGLDFVGGISGYDELRYSKDGFTLVENGELSYPFGKSLVAENEWMMLTLASNGSKLTLYINGVDVGNVALSSYRQFCFDAWELKGGAGAVALDDLKVFTSCLSTVQIKEIYALEKPLAATHTVIQEAAVPTLSESEMTCESLSGVYTVSLTLPNRVKWTAESDVSWIHVSTNGTGSATISFSVDKNVETHARVGTITIAGLTYTVRQKGTGVSLPQTVFLAAFDGSDVVEIPVQAGDADTHWTVRVVQNLQGDSLFPESDDGTGPGMLTVFVGECLQEAYSQIGIIEISGCRAYIVQRDFDLELQFATTNFTWRGGAGSVDVMTEDVDFDIWQALSDADWITITGAANGSGDGKLTYEVAENTTGMDRVGRIIVAGEICEIRQKAPGVAVDFEIVGNDCVLAGAQAVYRARLVYSDGERVEVSADWAVPMDTLVTINDTGLLTAKTSAGFVKVNASHEAAGKRWQAVKEVEILNKPVSLRILTDKATICAGDRVKVTGEVVNLDGTVDPVALTTLAVQSGDGAIEGSSILQVGSLTGEISVSATYEAAGLHVSATKTLTVRSKITAEEAVGGGLTYSTSGDAAWTVDTELAHDGQFSLRSGSPAVGAASEIAATVTGAGLLSCWLKASTSDDVALACGDLLVDGAVVATVSGVTDWTNVVCTVSTWGSHQIVWRYRKTVAGDYGEDCIWLDDVVWTATAVAPVSLTVQGSDRVVVAQTTQYACTAQYNDGSSKSVSASWSVVSGTNCAEINGVTGLLTAKKDGSARIRASYTEKDVTKTATFDVTVVKGLVSVSVSGLSKLYAGDSSTYVCTATYTDGSSAAVSANWTLSSGANCASINSSGLLTALDADGEATVKASFAYEGVTKTSTHTVQIARQIAVSSDTTGGKAANVPVSWVQKYPKFKSQYGHDFAAAMSVSTGKKDGANKPLKVWDDYVAGTDPTDEKDVFRAEVEMIDGLPHVSWKPNLNEEDETRTYKVYGRRSLSGTDAWEYPANSAVHQFFKVDVAMPDDNDGGSDAPGEVDSWLSAVIPMAVSGLVYDGTSKQGVLPGVGYLLSNASATGAGSYVATASLASGYRWVNGSQADQSIPWNIAKANNAWKSTPSMSATTFLAGTTVTVVDGVPKFGSVTRNYSDSAIRSLSAGSYMLTSSVAESANYAELTHSIPFTVTNPVTKISLPTANAGLVYTGSSQTGVSSGTGYTITGNTAINAGNYTATVTLQNGYAWSDGTTSKSRAISWSIAKATNSWLTEPSLSSTEFEAGTSVTVSMGAVRFGVRQANYTAAELAGLPAGSYTLVVSVAGTDNYTGLTKSIPFVVTEPSRAVTGVNITPTSLVVNGIGKTNQLVAKVLPSTAEDRLVTWSSSDVSVATVDNGVVTAKGLGSSTITVTTHEGNFSKSCSVTVASDCISAGTDSDISNLKLYSGSNYPKSGNGAWIVQDSQVYAGSSALRSGSRTNRSYDSYVGTIVYGSGTISFWWKVSSSIYDKLRFYVEGAYKAEISGTGGGWQYVSVRLEGPGYHRLRWTYNNYNANYAKAGDDCGWVDCIRWDPDTTSTNPPTQIVITGSESMTSQERKTYSGKVYRQSGSYSTLSTFNEVMFGTCEILPIWSLDESDTLATIDPYTGELSANGAVGTVTVRATYSENGVIVSATKIVGIND